MPNNVYGHGRIDAAAAVDLVKTGGTLVGTITDAADDSPLGGARITAIGPERTFSTVSGEDGGYRLFLAAGTYVVTASVFGYGTETVVDVEIITDETTVVDLALTALPRFTVSGVVRSAENGSPIAEASVRALGTPVAPVTTDRRGRYSITLPLGTYTLEASLGGCMQRAQEEVAVLANTTQDFAIARNLDRFGHGCDPTRFKWDNVKDQTALFGDDVYGRLRLPFSFPFYGERYDAVFVDSNGYLAFEDPIFSEFFNTAIPSRSLPNNAIYPLWQDLVIDEQAAVDYSLSGNTAVIEYRNVRPFGGEARGDFQVKLSRDGAIEVHYGSGVDDLGGGSRATIGLENADGTDALQFGFRERLVAPGDAYRYTRVATSLIRGTVTNVNDGLPVEGATVVATPGGQTGQTGPDGTYELRVIAGSYLVEASAPNYISETGTVSVGRNGTVTLDFSLRAARAEVSPTTIAASVDVGDTTTETVTIANTGSAPLTFELRERDFGGTPPELPPVALSERVIRPPEWARVQLPDGVRPAVGTSDVTCNQELDVIIDDPASDAVGSIDITTVRGGTDGTTMSMAIDFTAQSPLDEIGGFVHLDTDQDPTTGLPPEALFGLPTQDIGFDYFVDLFELPFEPIVLIVNATTFEIEAIVPAAIEDQSVCFDVPTEIFGPDHDGTMDVTMVVGDFFEPTDWAPDVGHGTIEAFGDAPWMAADPEEGTLDPGESLDVTLTLGGEGIDPGDYEGLLVFQTNDPRQAQHPVEVTLEVILPEDFGALGGTVTDAFSEEPVASASILVDAERDGAPHPILTTTDSAGTYLLFGPEGTWPVEVSADGYVTEAGEVTIVAGRQGTADFALIPSVPIAVVEGGPLEFVVEEGGSDSAPLTVRNEGFEDLDFTISEREVAAAPERGRAGPVPSGVTSQDRPAGTTSPEATPQQAGAEVLVLMDELPWDSAATLELFEAHDVIPDVAGSGAIGEIDLDLYDVVVVANDQPDEFYDAYNENLGWFEDFAATGGYLWVGAASLGFNGGSFDGELPGGVLILEAEFEELNEVVDPDHPAMAGVPDPFFGDFASHSGFQDLLPGTNVIAVGAEAGLPTLIEYALGAGMVLATAQPLEFGFEFGEDTGLVLENLVPYVAAQVRAGDVPWLTAEPDEGTVTPGEELEVTVTVDASDLEEGFFEAILIFATNDPNNRRILVPVSLEVVGSG